MTTAVPDDSDDMGMPRRTGSVRAAVVSLREAFDRPLTSYYMLLGASALLLTIGLVMVLSASSVWSFKVYEGDSYAVVRRQLMWLSLGLPAAFVASRMPLRWVRRAGLPGLPALAGPAAGHRVRGHLGQRQPELVGRGLAGHPALRGRQAGPGAVGCPHLRQQGTAPAQPAPARGAGGAGPAAGHAAGGGRSRPRHRPGLLRDPARHALGGRRARPALLAGDLAGQRRRDRAGGHRHRAASRGSPPSPTPSRTISTPAGSPPTASTRSPPAAGSDRASAPASRSGATCPRRTPTTSSRCSARSSAWSAPCWSSCSS